MATVGDGAAAVLVEAEAVELRPLCRGLSVRFSAVEAVRAVHRQVILAAVAGAALEAEEILAAVVREAIGEPEVQKFEVQSSKFEV